MENFDKKTFLKRSINTKRITGFLNKVLNVRKSDTKYIKSYMTAFIVLIVLLVLASNFKVGYAVKVNNVNVGYVKEMNQTYVKLEELQNELEEFSDLENKITLNTDFTPAISFNKNVSDNSEEIINNVKNAIDFYSDAFAVYVDGEFAFGTESKETAENMIDAFKKLYTPDGEIISAEFQNTVDIKHEKVLYTRILDEKKSIKVLKGYRQNDKLYTVQDGDTLWDIGIKNDITVDDLMLINEIDSEIIVPGQKLRTSEVQPLLKVKVIRNITYTEYQPYETEYIYDSSLTKGTNKIVQNGSKGEKTINATVTTLNNHETDRKITSETIVSEPVKGIIKVGTKPKPKTAATGRFMRPISGGYVSSAFGNRSRGYHTGVDYALSYGSPIYASDGGTVTSSGWGGGYGYMIKISHGNGYETLYAHCSRLVVRAGTKVAKGQIIAYVGSTGNSTGPHLHFEIRKNGSYVNPAKYV